MAAGVFVFDVLVTLLLSGYLLYSYGNWMRHRLAVTLAVLIAWYFSFLIIFIIPLDVSSTAYKQCVNATKAENGTVVPTKPPSRNGTYITEAEILQAKNLSHVSKSFESKSKCVPPSSLLDDNVLPDLWRVVYWTSQLLTWLILPLMQSYTQAGEFTVVGKLKSALWDNAIYYMSYLLIALVLIIYIALQPDLKLDWERTKAIAAAASNTWGLFVLVLMLGYGLVEVPRNCWNRTQRGFQLNRAYFKVDVSQKML